MACFLMNKASDLKMGVISWFLNIFGSGLQHSTQLIVYLHVVTVNLVDIYFEILPKLQQVLKYAL